MRESRMAGITQYAHVKDLTEVQVCDTISEMDYGIFLARAKGSWSLESVPILVRYIQENGLIAHDEMEWLNSLQDTHNLSVSILIEFFSKKSGKMRLAFIDCLTKTLNKPIMRGQLMKEFREAIRASRPCRVEMVTADAEQLQDRRPNLHETMTDKEKKLLLCPVCDKIMTRPVLLKCLHSGCRSCIESLNTLSDNGSSNLRASIGGEDVDPSVGACNETTVSTLSDVCLSCPLCKEVHNGIIEENRHILLGIALLADRIKVRPCSNAKCSNEIGGNEKQIFHCNNCGGYVGGCCVEACCASEHSLQEHEAAIMQAILTCREHDSPLEFFCRDCYAWRCKDYAIRTCRHHRITFFLGSDSREIEKLHGEIRMQIDCVERLAKSLKHAHLYGASILDSKSVFILEQEEQLVNQFRSLLRLREAMSTPAHPSRELAKQCDGSASEQRLLSDFAHREPFGEVSGDPNEQVAKSKGEQPDAKEQLEEMKQVEDLTDAMDRHTVSESPASYTNRYQVCTTFQCELGVRAFRNASARIADHLTEPQTNNITSALFSSGMLIAAEREQIMKSDGATMKATCLVDIVRTKGIMQISEFYNILKTSDIYAYGLVAELLKNSERCTEPSHFPK